MMHIGDHSSFKNNTAITDGGAITNFHTLTISKATFSSNSVTTSGDFGGAIESVGTDTLLSISDNSFTRNSASFGGAFYNEFATATIRDATFSFNVASTDGGGLYADRGSKVTISKSTFSHNKAADGTDDSGGGISNFATVVISKSKLSDNRARNCDSAALMNGPEDKNSIDDKSCEFS